MAPYEALYGRKCHSPICWDEIGERTILGPKILSDSEEKVKIIRERLRIAQSRYKSYADKRRRELEFNEGDFVYLKVSPMRGVRKFGLHGKLSPRYVGPFRIIRRRGPLAYKLELAGSLSKVQSHN